MPGPVATVIIVNYQGRDKLRRCLASVAAQDAGPLETIVVDNASPDGSGDEAEAVAGVRLVRNTRNVGFGAACNQAAALASSPYLVFLNNDSVADPRCISALLAAASAEPAAGAVQAVVVRDDGSLNTAGNRLHFLGFSWAPLGPATPDQARAPYETACGSGAALLVPRDRFESVGGFWDAMFLYCEDTDLSWRLRLRGWPILVCPAARTVHEYEFGRTATKHYFLERNRMLMLLANYGRGSLVRLAPALVASELGIIAVAARQGWLRHKLRATGGLVRATPALAVQRRRVQSSRTAPDAAVTAVMETRLGDEFGRVARWTAVPLRLYARLSGLMRPAAADVPPVGAPGPNL
jgi:GT2 family glycosyltransferase